MKNEIAGDSWQPIRRVACVAMIVLATYVAGRITEVPVLFLWAVFPVVLSVYCGATTRLAQPASNERLLETEFTAWSEALAYGENRQQTDFPIVLPFTAPVVDSTTLR